MTSLVVFREWYELPDVDDRAMDDESSTDGPESSCNTTGFVQKSFEVFNLYNYDLQFKDENWTNIRCGLDTSIACIGTFV